MFGFACDETPELMPAPIMFAHRLGRELTRIRKSGKARWLRPDAKSQVSVDLRGRQAGRHFQCRHLDPALEGREALRDSQLHHRRSHPEGFAERDADRRDGISDQPDRQLRHRRSGRRHRPDGTQDHRRQLRRLGPARRRRVFRQGPEQGGPQRGLHGALGGEERRRFRAWRSAAKSSSPTPSVIRIRSA